MNKRVVITGGAGYIGTRLIQTILNKTNYFVICADSFEYGKKAIWQFMDHPRFRWAYCDVTNEAQVSELLWNWSPNAIIHLAGVVGAPICDMYPDWAKSVHVNGALNIQKHRGRAWVFTASTGSNYGAVEGVCTEETPLNPLSVYGKTKTRAEQILLQGENTCAYRFATLYGASPRMRLDLLPNTFTYDALFNGGINVYEPNARRTFFHISDAVTSIIYALDKGLVGVYNAGDDRGNMTKMELASIIASVVLERAGRGVALGSMEGTDPDKRDYAVSYDKIRAMGFQGSTSIQSGISEVVDYLSGGIKLHNFMGNGVKQ